MKNIETQKINDRYYFEKKKKCIKLQVNKKIIRRKKHTYFNFLKHF